MAAMELTVDTVPEVVVKEDTVTTVAKPTAEVEEQIQAEEGEVLKPLGLKIQLKEVLEVALTVAAVQAVTTIPEALMVGVEAEVAKLVRLVSTLF